VPSLVPHRIVPVDSGFKTHGVHSDATQTNWHSLNDVMQCSPWWHCPWLLYCTDKGQSPEEATKLLRACRSSEAQHRVCSLHSKPC
jgi:proteasome lid subunit RPN8/RPN11